MRFDVIDLGCRIHDADGLAFSAKRMTGKE